MFMLRRETGELAQFGGFLDGTETFVGRWVPGLLALYTEFCCEPGMTRELGTCSTAPWVTTPQRRSGRWNWSS